MIVVDASVAAKWYLNESGSDEAAELLGSRSVLVAPSLIRLEVHGAVIRRFREGRLSIELAREACGLWESALGSGALRLVPDPDLIDSAREIAFGIRHAIQDCLYLAAATALKADLLVTADPTFHARAKESFPFVELRSHVRAH